MASTIKRKARCRQLAAIIACFGCLLFISQAQAAPPEGYDFLSYDAAMTQARQQEKLVFLYFGRYGCSTCRKMHQEVFSDDEIMQRYNEHYILAYVDTESGERLTLPNSERITEMQFASRMRILGTPTFYFLTPDERTLVKLAGFKSIEGMKQYDDFVYGGHYGSQSFKEYVGSR